MTIDKQKIMKLFEHNFIYTGDVLIDDDGLINIKYGGCKLKQTVDRIPVNFKHVDGLFNCSGNELITLDGCPYYAGEFDCSYNLSLTSLKGSPKIVKGNFKCYLCDIISLIGGPSSVGGSFFCNINKLISLDGSPSTIGGSFFCKDNHLVTLSGIPKSINGQFVMTVYTDTPLLKILKVKGINDFLLWPAIDMNLSIKLQSLFKKYYGKKNGQILLGLEMMKFKEFRNNARL